MKIVPATLALIVAMPALAQTAPASAPAAAPAGHAAHAAAFSLDTPIEMLVADPRAKAVLDANLPGMTNHPSYDSFKSMSLRAVQPFSGGKLTDEVLKKTETDLAAIH